MINYANAILNRLLDKYENSKSFTGENKHNQNFKLLLTKEFPEYSDDSKIEEIKTIDYAASELQSKGFIICKKQKNGLLSHVFLNTDSIDKVYTCLKRTPKKDLNSKTVQLLKQYSDKNELLADFCNAQISRIASNKKVEHFNGDIKEFENVLKALSCIFDISKETFQRDFSVRVFGDSKVFEKIRNTVTSILFEYGDFPAKETILEDLNIVSNPGHVYFKGDGVLSLSGQVIDLSRLDGDIAISSSMLKEVASVEVAGKRVITIENLTTFNAYKPDNEFVIYLGGYLNNARRMFIEKLYANNLDKEYYHFGDIDAGGFYILLHLRKKTGVNFLPFQMDIETISKNIEYTKKLTENDRRRLENLKEGEFGEVICFLLDNNCKLEQESLDWD